MSVLRRIAHRLFPLVISACALPVLGDEITVFAAASLKDVMDDVAIAFESSSGKRVLISHAGSSALARQLYQGAPAEIFVSANVAWMDWLVEEAVIEPVTRRDLVENRLVVVAPRALRSTIATRSMDDLPGLLSGGRLAMAMVEAVPAGIYGREALVAMDLWQLLEPNVVQTDNVRAALRLVAIEEVALGIVYATDALADPSVRVIGHFDPSLHTPIVYPVGLSMGASMDARAFVDFLFQMPAQTIFVKHGFRPVEQH